jgi:glycosyltransferase involved in cell wall biosynthesis
MKICLINTLYYPNIVGGAEQSVQFLAEELVRKGHQVFVISLAPQHGIRSAEHNGVTVFTVGHHLVPWPFQKGGIPWFLKPYYFALDSFYNPFICHAVEEILVRERPDVVHTNNIFGFSPQVWKLVKAFDIPLVHTLRDHSLLCTRSTMWRNGDNCQKQCPPCRIHTLPRKILCPYVDGVIGISNYLLTHHQHHQLFNKVAIKAIIHNPYSSDDAEPSFVTSPRHNGPLVFGFLGRLEKQKGVELLLEAFSAASNQHNCSLLLAGEGDAAYKSTLRRQYSSPAIQFLGFVPPQTFFNKIDILIVPSLWQEPLGRVIFEGYHHGIPVIGSTRGGIPEIIEDGKTGLLFDPSIPESLTDKLNYACNNPQRIKAMKSVCLEMAKNFLPAVIVDQYINIYQKAISIHHGSPVSNSRR